MIYSSHIELSKSALKNNLDFIYDTVGKDCTFFSVVKGNAYGHGIEPYSKLAFACGVKHFAVFSSTEAEELVKTKIDLQRLIIMGFIDNKDLEWAIEHDIEFFVFDDDRLEHAIQSAKKLGKPARVHIELETGLNRTGYTDNELELLFIKINNNKEHLIVEGLCSHLSGAESISNYVRIKKQINKFNKLTRLATKNDIPYRSKHIACSAATLNYPKTNMDLARVGILQYGFWPSRETKVAYYTKHKITSDPLKRVISWKSKVLNIKKVNTGEYISYGNSALAETDMLIAAIPVGYSNGFNRSLSNQGRVLISGKRANIIGMVNMNMILADITHINNVKINDEVVLIGNQGEEHISVSSFSDLSDQLNYELLTRLPTNIPRRIVE